MQKLHLILIACVLISCSRKVTLVGPAIPYEQKTNFGEVIGCLDRPADYPEPDRWAMYHLGLKGLNQDLSRTVFYPEKAKNQKLEGMVLVRFVVETDGYIYKTEVVNSTSEIFEEAAQKGIKDLEQWIPALINNKPVASLYKLPVYFRLPK